jgi:hypothetical protein
MITKNLFNGSELHSSPHFQDQSCTTPDALAEVVHTLDITHFHYGAWVEDIHLDGDNSFVKVGSYGMAGERWIEVYEGPEEELHPLAKVCWWFYKAGGEISDELKANRPEGFTLKQDPPVFLSPSAGYKPWHGGRHELVTA